VQRAVVLVKTFCMGEEEANDDKHWAEWTTAAKQNSGRTGCMRLVFDAPRWGRRCVLNAHYIFIIYTTVVPFKYERYRVEYESIPSPLVQNLNQTYQCGAGRDRARHGGGLGQCGGCDCRGRGRNNERRTGVQTQTTSTSLIPTGTSVPTSESNFAQRDYMSCDRNQTTP
jgi:hypothetical protein